MDRVSPERHRGDGECSRVSNGLDIEVKKSKKLEWSFVGFEHSFGRTVKK